MIGKSIRQRGLNAALPLLLLSAIDWMGRR